MKLKHTGVKQVTQGDIASKQSQGPSPEASSPFPLLESKYPCVQEDRAPLRWQLRLSPCPPGGPRWADAPDLHQQQACHSNISGRSGGAYLPAAGFRPGLGSHLDECLEHLSERAFVTNLLMFLLLHKWQ